MHGSSVVILRDFGGYMKMQRIWGRPKTAAVTMVLALGLGGLAVAAADHLMQSARHVQVRECGRAGEPQQLRAGGEEGIAVGRDHYFVP